MLYSPTIGICLLFGCFFSWIPNAIIRSNEQRAVKSEEIRKDNLKHENQKAEPQKATNNNHFVHKTYFIVYCALFVILVLMMTRTWARTSDWQSDETLFKSAVQTCPRSAKMHQQLGQVC